MQLLFVQLPAKFYCKSLYCFLLMQLLLLSMPYYGIVLLYCYFLCANLPLSFGWLLLSLHEAKTAAAAAERFCRCLCCDVDVNVEAEAVAAAAVATTAVLNIGAISIIFRIFCLSFVLFLFFSIFNFNYFYVIHFVYFFVFCFFIIVVYSH